MYLHTSLEKIILLNLRKFVIPENIFRFVRKGILSNKYIYIHTKKNRICDSCQFCSKDKFQLTKAAVSRKFFNAPLPCDPILIESFTLMLPKNQ